MNGKIDRLAELDDGSWAVIREVLEQKFRAAVEIARERLAARKAG